MGEMWFGHYRLERLLGSGATGRVRLAYDTRAGRRVALKVLTAEADADPAYRQRFLREARAAARLRGPHTVRVHGFGELDGRLYLDMEFVDGVDGAELLRREGRLAPEAAVRLVVQAATALDAAHRAGVVHRDVKPSNLMVTPDGGVRLIDFGIAGHAGQPSITATGHVVGTLGYMAPERFAGTADARSDQYSLGCVLYELLTGRRPFGDGDSPQQMRAHLMTAPPAASALAPGVPADLDAAIIRAMAKDPTHRWAGAGDFAAAAYRAVRGQEMPTVDLAPKGTVLDGDPAGTSFASTAPVSAAWPAEDPAAIVRAAGSAAAAAQVAGRPGPTRGTGRAGFRESVRGPAPTRPFDGGRGPSNRSRLALAASGGLVAVIAGALWVGEPESVEAESVTPTTQFAPITTVPTAAPIARRPAPIAPVLGQPCDPAVNGAGFSDDGVSLRCTGFGDGAVWARIPAQPVAAVPGEVRVGRDGSGSGPGNSPKHSNSGNGNATGNSGDGHPGNGNDKNKPRKPDK